MKTSRNDPCPCGSGKKYKACCMASDEARARARSVMGAEAFDQAEAEWLARARQEREWEVDIAPAPGGIRGDPDAALSLVMVTAGEWVAHAEVLSHRPAGAAERARDMIAAVKAAHRALGVLPERLNVPDEDLVEPVSQALAGHGIAVLTGDAEQLFYALNSALANMDPGGAQGRMTVALSWRETEASPEELSDFHEAAAAFFTAVPWASRDTEGPFLLDLPRDREEKPMPELDLPEKRQWAASVMGALGESFGLVLHSQPVDLANIYESRDPSTAFTDSIGFAITVEFDRKRELTRTMQREVAAAGWAIAAPRAYPRLFGVSLPGRRVVARDVRVATLALRAIAVFARGGDPLAETGVAVAPFDPDAEYEDRLDWFRTPDQARRIGAEGADAGADAGWEATLEIWDKDLEAFAAAADKRTGRFSTWLTQQGVAEEEALLDVQNAKAWEWSLVGAGHAGAVTEFDLRLFLYDTYLRKCRPSAEAVRAFPRSMRRILRHVEEQEQIRYPFAAGVLDELEEIESRARELDEPLEEALHALSHDVYDDLDRRALLPDDNLAGVPDGWPDGMSIEVARLRHELHRRWLSWYDELVCGGMTDYGELGDALVARQREWESTPHPGFDGRTPAEVVAAQEI